MKKIVSLFLVLMLVLSLSVAAFAVQTTTNGATMTNGTITVAGATPGYEYALYKLLHLDTYNHEKGAYIYKIEAKWDAFFRQTSINGVYVIIDENDHVSWVDGADVAEFGKIALAYAEANGILPEAKANDGTSSFTFNTSGTGGVFNNLSLGYYLVDTSMGALCGLSTAKPDGHISAKNGVPTLDKNVQEDSHVDTGTAEYGASNTADIGQVVNFDVTVYAQAGAEKYVYHDQMSDGLGLKADTVTVIYHSGSINQTLTNGVEYTLNTNPTCTLDDWDCTFEVVFAESFLKTIHSNDKIYIRYSAVVTDLAVIGSDGNDNSAQLSYGSDHQTTIDSTTTYTYGFDIYKTDANMNPLQGAEFQLLDENKNVITLAYDPDTNEYRKATKAVGSEQYPVTTITVSAADGVARVVGLDNGTYYLKETKAPAGYKLLNTEKQFIISGHNLFVDKVDGVTSIGASVHVENNRGITLPETGGIGTLLFTVLGGTTAMGTGVVLVTKKRMSKIKDED